MQEFVFEKVNAALWNVTPSSCFWVAIGVVFCLWTRADFNMSTILLVDADPFMSSLSCINKRYNENILYNRTLWCVYY
jgi:hypothetical protein